MADDALHNFANPPEPIPDGEAHDRWQSFVHKRDGTYQALAMKLMEEADKIQVVVGHDALDQPEYAPLGSLPLKTELKEDFGKGMWAIIDLAQTKHFSPVVLTELLTYYLVRAQHETSQGNNSLEAKAALHDFVEDEILHPRGAFITKLENEARVLRATFDPLPIVCTEEEAQRDAERAVPQRNKRVLQTGAEMQLRGERMLEAIQKPLCDAPIAQPFSAEALVFAKLLAKTYTDYHADPQDPLKKAERAASIEVTDEVNRALGGDSGNSGVFAPARMLHSTANAEVLLDALREMSRDCASGRTDYANMVKQYRAGGAWHNMACSMKMCDERNHSMGQPERFSLIPTLKEAMNDMQNAGAAR